MRKIFLPPELYPGIEDLDYTTKWLLFDLIYRYNLWLPYEVDEKVKIVFGFFKPFFDKDINDFKTYCETKKENGKKWWRPKKDFENLENSQKPKKPKKPIDIDIDIYNNNIFNKEDNKSIILLNNDPEFYFFVDQFIDPEVPQIKYQLSKNPGYLQDQYKEVDKLIKDWYTQEAIQTVLAYVKQDDFRSKQILSVKKLRAKDKDWIPYIVRMIEKIQQWKPKVLDFDK